jgi:predicted house-cleaning noncanonical NTP pyrophosphatase (MazG superfamily)
MPMQKEEKSELRNKLKEKLRIKNLERTPRFIRDKKLEELEDR